VIAWQKHLIILPIVIPMLTGAAMLLLGDAHRRVRAGLGLAAMVTMLVLAIGLVLGANLGGQFPFPPSVIGVYLLGNWAAPFGIVLVVDRLAAAMLLLTAIIGLAALVFALARWQRAGVHFHPLLQFQIMGLNGAFLTGDLFNLFVFFEILLAASYGLLLHGSGMARVKAGLHYIAVNLAASFVFLIGVSLIYGAVGTLNMADLALRLAALDAADRPLAHAGLAMLGVAFLIKAAAWPLNFWLPAAYSAACAPVAALFALMSKVGIYAVLRVSSVLSVGDGTLTDATPQVFAAPWLFAIGAATAIFGAIGLLASSELRRQASYALLVSSGTLLMVIGQANTAALGPALYYLVSATLAVSAFFLLIEMIEFNRPYAANVLALTQEAFGLDEDEPAPNAPDEVIGVVIPLAMATLGGAFIACALLITGLPPLSGFLAKLGMLGAVLHAGGDPGTDVPIATSAWVMLAVVLGCGLAGMMALARSGIRTFWTVERTVRRLRPLEAVPMLGLLALCLLLTVAAQPATRYFEATARSLHNPAYYIDAVRAAASPATSTAVMTATGPTP